jgi:hypothetical protein
LEEGARDFANPAIPAGSGAATVDREWDPVVRKEMIQYRAGSGPFRVGSKKTETFLFKKIPRRKIILENKIKIKYRSVIYQKNQKNTPNLMGYFTGENKIIFEKSFF